ncbi:MAG: TldD/PmbA family protein [Candidatus Delongbacteria bacterium]|nr:TldD/PmbA family protein [Candidatus Delongbacteria bacterium]
MFVKMKELLNRVDADYADFRYEKRIVTSISFRTREISNLSKNSTDGYVLRVLKNGGFATVAFNDLKDADFAVKNAVTNAELYAKRTTKKVEFASAPVVKDEVIPEQIEDPRNISFEEKLDLIKKYNEILLKPEKVIATDLAYYEINRDKWFVSTEGSEIHEELLTTRLGGSVTSGDETQNQDLRIKAGGSNGFQNVRNLEGYIEDRAKLVVELLDAESVKGGTYDCIIDPTLTGVFTHEAFGHFSEADITENSPSLREKMKIGEKLGNEIVNITDNATLADQLGNYKYDDEGVAVRKTELMKKGVLTGRLHSRKTAHEFGEPISGHMIAEDYRYAPIIRMGTIFIEPTENTKEKLFSTLGDGLYLCEGKGGQTAGENFTFGASYGYIVENGEIKKMIKDLNISGNLFQTLADISMIGDDFTLSKVGGCGKGQTNLRSCYGGPHILIKNLVVGGK